MAGEKDPVFADGIERGNAVEHFDHVGLGAALVFDSRTTASRRDQDVAALVGHFVADVLVCGAVDIFIGIGVFVACVAVEGEHQRIFFGAASTTLGATGSLTSTAIRDSIKMVCVVAGASSNWNVISAVGNITVA